MLKIENLTFRYPGRKTPAIDNLSMAFEGGAVYGLLGSNGAGKSTLLYLIAGLLTPQSGEVTLKGVNTRRRLPQTLSDIFIVPDELTLPAVTLDTFVKINAPFYPRFSEQDMYRHLATFEVGDVTRYKLTSLSLGQRKKVFMSFALACNTSLLLMDEPTNGLDIPSKAAFRRFIASSVTDDKTIIISTHQVRDIDKIIDHVVIMDNQTVLLNSSMSEISRKLAFISTADSELINSALVSLPAVGGAQIVIANDGSYDTEANLELLFDLATTKRETINSMFNTVNKQ